MSVPFVFALAYFFTDQIGAILADVHRLERWVALAALIVLAGGVVVYVVRWNRRVPKAPRTGGLTTRDGAIRSGRRVVNGRTAAPP